MNKLFEKGSILSLVYFRILFGLIMMIETYRYFTIGWIKRYYIDPDVLFKFFGFEWVTAATGNGMYYVFALLGITSFFIMIGFLYRISIIIFFFTFSYIFLLGESYYLNHFYFTCLISFAMMFTSPHRYFSIDSKVFPKIKSTQIEKWQPWSILFLMSVVYFYGGLAKIDPDWLNANPLHFWLQWNVKANIPYYLSLFMAWSGMLFDLFIPFALAYPKTRKISFIIMCIFHTSNHFIFHIGIFPWLSIAISIMYFGSDFPKYFLNKLKKPIKEIPLERSSSFNTTKRFLSLIIILFISYNLIMPLRQFLFKGTTHWTENGHRFSWRMKLRTKTKSKAPRYFVKNLQTGKVIKVKPQHHLSIKQIRKLKGNPDLILEFAHIMQKELQKTIKEPFSITVKAKASVNFRPLQYIIDPNVDLTKIKECFICDRDFIVPLKTKRTFKESRLFVKKRINRTNRFLSK